MAVGMRLSKWLYSLGNIKFKVMGITLSLALVLGTAVILQARSSLNHQARDHLGRQAVSLAHFVAARGTDLVLTHNVYGLRELLRDTVAYNPNLRYVIIYDTGGKVVDSTFGREFPVDLLTLPERGEDGHLAPTLLKAGEETIYDLAVPMFEGRAGSARVGMTDRQVNASIEDAVRRMWLETIGITGVALLAAYLLTILLTRPLEDLVAVTFAVRVGNLGKRARIFGSDEIGLLSTSVNDMIDGLQASQEELLKRNRDLTLLNQVAEAVSRPLGEGQVLQEIMTDVQTALGLERVCIFRVGAQNTELPCYCSTVDMPPACFAPPAVRGEVAAVKEPMINAEGGVVPLLAEGRVVGVMCFHGHGQTLQPNSTLESGLLSALGRQIGIALENIRLWEELQAKEAVRAELVNQLISAQEAERKRIALELHDQTGQLLTSMMVGLKLLEQASSPDQAHSRIADLRNIASTVLEEVHSLALELRPPVLDDLGLVHALDRYVRDFARKHRIQVDLQAEGFAERRLPTYVGTTLYRVAQEALTNVVRHSGARSVSLSFSWQLDRVTGIIHDDGRGFDLHTVQREKTDRLGLFSMQERAKLAGGKVEIRSRPGNGTTILVQVPATEIPSRQEGGHSA